MIFEKRDGIEDHGRRAKTALDRAVLDKRLLNGMEFAPLRNSLDRCDFFSFGLDGQKQTGQHGFSIQENGATTAVADIAAPFCAR